MKIRLMGVRGSIPAPLTSVEYRDKIERILKRFQNTQSTDINLFIKSLPNDLRNVVGGNTTCVELISDSGTQYILDAGTGIRLLGDELMEKEQGTGNTQINIMISHTHWDHIQGIPFFKPIYIPGNTIRFFSGIKDLEKRMNYQTDFRFFPVPFNAMGSNKSFHYLKIDEPFQLEENLTVTIHPLKHPGGSTAYRFESDRGVFIFATDVEITGDYLEADNNDSSFFDNADLIILDAQYTLDESFQKFDWGHTSFTMAINCGIKWKTRHIVLTHHEPAYSDFKLYENFKDALRHRKALGKSKPILHLAREGARFTI